MYQYFFILGSNHSLSKVEIIAIFNKDKIDFKIISPSSEILILETNNEINPQHIINKLGGTIKVGKILDSIPYEQFLVKLEKLITDLDFLSNLFDPTLKKISFGISVYNAGAQVYQINNIFSVSIKTLSKIKQFLSSAYKVNFFKSHERYISSVSVVKNKLITDGFELDICVNDSTVYFGKTLAVQNFEDYNFRDYQRPGKDTEAGMLPPKLAKIMINIAGKNETSTILDPFCGNGTILQELILLGYKDITGTDYKDEQIQKTNQNIKWLFDKYHDLIKLDFNIKTFQIDVKKLSDALDNKSIDAIITEPFLGSPKSKHFNISQIENEISILEKLYLDSFYQFKSILKNDGKIVIIFPAFKLGNNLYHLNILPQLLKLGFFPIDFNENLEYNNLNLEITERKSIIYFRPDQTIHREIFIFQLNI